MFNREKNPASSDRLFANSATLISAGTTLNGDVKSDNDLRIDGTIYGNVRSTAKIIVGPTGHIEGDIDGEQADITGRVTGNIVVRELLQLRGQCNVSGNIQATRLQVDPTAQFNGHCQMGTAPSSASVVPMPLADAAAEAK